MCKRPKFKWQLHKKTIKLPQPTPNIWHIEDQTAKWVYMTSGAIGLTHPGIALIKMSPTALIQNQQESGREKISPHLMSKQTPNDIFGTDLRAVHFTTFFLKNLHIQMEKLTDMDVHKKGITVLVCAKHRRFWETSNTDYSKDNTKPHKHLKKCATGLLSDKVKHLSDR